MVTRTRGSPRLVSSSAWPTAALQELEDRHSAATPFVVSGEYSEDANEDLENCFRYGPDEHQYQQQEEMPRGAEPRKPIESG